MERKAFKAADLATTVDGVVTAIVAVTANLDLGNDIIVPGAFAGFLGKVARGDTHLPALCWNHQMDRLDHITGKVLELRELPPGSFELPDKIRNAGWGGLYCRGQYNLETQAGRDAFQHVKAGDVVEFSFAFEAPGRSYDADGHRLLQVIDPIFEISNVLVGMNPATTLLGVKARREPIPDWMLAGMGLALADADRAVQQAKSERRVINAALDRLTEDARRHTRTARRTRR